MHFGLPAAHPRADYPLPSTVEWRSWLPLHLAQGEELCWSCSQSAGAMVPSPPGFRLRWPFFPPAIASLRFIQSRNLTRAREVPHVVQNIPAIDRLRASPATQRAFGAARVHFSQKDPRFCTCDIDRPKSCARAARGGPDGCQRESISRDLRSGADVST